MGVSDLSAHVGVHLLDHHDPDDVERLARELHETYEREAEIMGWQTQEGTSVAFDNLPEANRKTMLGVAKSIIERYHMLAIDVDVPEP